MRRLMATKHFPLDVERDGEYLTIWCGNDLVCSNLHFSEVADAYRKYVEDTIRPHKLIDYEVPPELLEFNHPGWFIEDD